MGKDTSKLMTRDGRDWKAAWNTYQGVVEQRAFFYGTEAAQQAAEIVLEAAKAKCPVETGHLRNSGRILTLEAGEINTGRDEGLGDQTGGYARNKGTRVMRIVSFNTTRLLNDGLSSTDSEEKVSLQRKKRIQRVSSSQKAYQSLRSRFNYAILIHETRIKFLEDAYKETKTPIAKLFKGLARDIFETKLGKMR